VLVSAVNVSEGRDGPALARIADAAGDDLLDLHRDLHHHRSVLTVAGADAVRRVAAAAVAAIDLRRHSGVHPRLGAVDVVPFVPFGTSTPAEAAEARDAFAAWARTELALPALVYREDGPTLPEVRARARFELLPHPTAGAVAVGARGPLVAYNVWLEVPDVALARRVARAVRGAGIRALGLPVGGRVQVSMNLVDPLQVGPAAAFDAVAAHARVAGAELVGLVPQAVLDAVAPDRWQELDLDARSSVEARLGLL
jgi:glutamate formiminotransferase